MAKTVSIIIPCFNEVEALPTTHATMLELLGMLIRENLASPASHICYVDDGSSDGTWPLIQQFSENSTFVKGLKLSRNQGHQNALLAGLLTTDGQVIISIDADLQDDVQAIPEMLRKNAEGFDIVYGVRDDRTSDSHFKRATAQLFYRILGLMGVEIIYNHADFRLLSRSAIEALREFHEVNLFLRGIVPLLGFKSTQVTYRRSARLLGESKYPLRKMLALAWQGITSLTSVPLRWVTTMGAIIFSLSILMTCFILAVRLFTDRAIPGWASTVVPIYLLGGVQILSIGIIGEYLAKIYYETKARPRYFIEETCGETQRANSPKAHISNPSLQ